MDGREDRGWPSHTPEEITSGSLPPKTTWHWSPKGCRSLCHSPLRPMIGFLLPRGQSTLFPSRDFLVPTCPQTCTGWTESLWSSHHIGAEGWVLEGVKSGGARSSNLMPQSYDIVHLTFVKWDAGDWKVTACVGALEDLMLLPWQYYRFKHPYQNPSWLLWKTRQAHHKILGKFKKSRVAKTIF